MKIMNKPRRPKWRRRRPSPLPEADSASAATTPESISGHFRSRRRFAAVLILTSLTTLGWFAAASAIAAPAVVICALPNSAGDAVNSTKHFNVAAEDSPMSYADSPWWYCDGRRMSSLRRRSPRRKGLAAKGEAERKRQELLKRTNREIDEIVAQFHTQLPRNQAEAIGVAYLRYSTRFQDSVADQLREILRHALVQKIFVPRELVFFDLAVRGVKNNRVGLNAASEALKRKHAGVLLLFSTSRLFRKQYRTLAFVDAVHRGLGIRCIFVKSGVDTNDKQRWEALLSVLAMVDQFVVTMNVANIQAAHQGQMEKRIVFGTLSYGYAGDPIPGEFTKRNKPRCKIIPDTTTAEVVQKIFRWYVDERATIAEIIRRLNDDESIPLPPRAESGEWTRLSVKRILSNSRYVGAWKYGVCESVYLPEQDYTRQTRRVEPLKVIQLDELRIISDELWHDAQLRLTKEGENRGRKRTKGESKSLPKVLNQLLYCPEHKRFLQVGGAHGHSMVCASCKRLPAAKQHLYTQLNRRLATTLTCRRLAELVSADAALIETIMAACLLEVETAQKPDPAELTSLRAQEQSIKRKIAFIRRTTGSTPDEEAEAETEIKALQAERAQGKVKLDRLEVALARQPKLPAVSEVQALVDGMRQILTDAALGESEENVAAAHEIIDLLTGGRIDLFQMGERLPQRGWLQGRFRVRLLPALVEKLTGVPATCCDDDAIEVVIDYREPASFDDEAESAWQFYQQDWLNAQIAVELKCSRSKITKLLKYAAAKHGQSLEDGRVRRARLAQKSIEPLKHQKIADEVMRRYDDDELLDDIAIALNEDRNLITAAVRWWHEVRGLPVPDGRTRRKSLKRKSRPSGLQSPDQAAE